MVFHIRSRLWWWTNTKPDGFEALRLVEGASSRVRLMGMQLKSLRRERLRQLDEARPPALAPFAWIDVQAVEIRAVHREVGNDLLVECANPDCTSGQNDVVKDPARMLEREGPPGRQVGVGGKPCAMPDRSGCDRIFILKGTNMSA